VVPGTQANSWSRLLQLSQQYSAILPALGLHPYFLQHFEPQHFTLLTQLLSQFSDRVVAVGEIGLDHVIDIAPAQQMAIFTQQLHIANDFSLPVILHHRRSHNDLIKTLKQQRFKWGGIVHAFSGSLHEAHTYVELGFKLGVGGVITYPRARKTREVVSQLPLEALVLETDAPDMPPMGKQGLRNSPQNLLMILDELSHLRQQSPEEIIKQCRQNVITTLKNIR
jgi:TatD DNase family protein